MTLFRIIPFAISMGFGTTFAATEPVLELAGVLAAPGKTSLQLSNLETHRTAWIQVGQTFAGYTISAYDQKTETATLTKDGRPTLLRLKSAKAIPANSALTPGKEIEIRKAVLNNLRQIGAASDQYFLEYNKTSVTLAELVGADKYIRQLNVIDGEDYSRMTLRQGEELKVTTANGIVVSFKQ